MKVTRRQFVSQSAYAVSTIAGLSAVPALAQSSPTITIESLQVRAINAGGTFSHRITVRNGSTPIANVVVGIYDPVAQFCAQRTTNSQGQVTYSTQTNANTPGGVYTFVAVYGTARSASTVAVRLPSVLALPNYKVDFVSTATPSNSTLVCGDRASGNGLTQLAATTVSQAVALGKEVVVGYVSNPGNLAIVTVTGISCTAGLVIPIVGQAACAIGVRIVGTSILKDTAIAVGKKLIDATSMTTTQKQQAKALLDGSSAAYDLIRFRPGNAWEDIGAVSNTWSFGGATIQWVTSGGVNRGFSVAAPITGTSDVLQLGCYKR